MNTFFVLPTSMFLGTIVWTLAFRSYAAKWFFEKDLATALRPLLLLHSFRYIGLMFLIPGVTSEPLDPRFAVPAAVGDLAAAVFALAALWALNRNNFTAISTIALFNVVGFADLIYAVSSGMAYTPDGALGATFWIPAVIVPLLLVTHVFIFVRLAREATAEQLRESPRETQANPIAVAGTHRSAP